MSSFPLHEPSFQAVEVGTNNRRKFEMSPFLQIFWNSNQTFQLSNPFLRSAGYVVSWTLVENNTVLKKKTFLPILAPLYCQSVSKSQL